MPVFRPPRSAVLFFRKGGGGVGGGGQGSARTGVPCRSLSVLPVEGTGEGPRARGASGRPAPPSRPRCRSCSRGGPPLPKSDPQLQKAFLQSPGSPHPPAGISAHIPAGRALRAFASWRPDPPSDTPSLWFGGEMLLESTPTQLFRNLSVSFTDVYLSLRNSGVPNCWRRGRGCDPDGLAGPPSLQEVSAGPLQNKLAKADLALQIHCIRACYFLPFQELRLGPFEHSEFI